MKKILIIVAVVAIIVTTSSLGFGNDSKSNTSEQNLASTQNVQLPAAPAINKTSFLQALRNFLRGPNAGGKTGAGVINTGSGGDSTNTPVYGCTDKKACNWKEEYTAMNNDTACKYAEFWSITLADANSDARRKAVKPGVRDIYEGFPDPKPAPAGKPTLTPNRDTRAPTAQMTPAVPAGTQTYDVGVATWTIFPMRDADQMTAYSFVWLGGQQLTEADAGTYLNTDACKSIAPPAATTAPGSPKSNAVINKL